jgi:hypothetical protein
VLAQDGEDLAAQHDGADGDEDGDRQRDAGVPPRVAGGAHHDAGGDDTDRPDVSATTSR